MYVYISEQEIFTDYKSKEALFWLEEELVYGDWTSGPAGDGSYTKTGQLKISEVGIYKYHFLVPGYQLLHSADYFENTMVFFTSHFLIA